MCKNFAFWMRFTEGKKKFCMLTCTRKKKLPSHRFKSYSRFFFFFSITNCKNIIFKCNKSKQWNIMNKTRWESKIEDNKSCIIFENRKKHKWSSRYDPVRKRKKKKISSYFTFLMIFVYLFIVQILEKIKKKNRSSKKKPFFLLDQLLSFDQTDDIVSLIKLYLKTKILFICTS